MGERCTVVGTVQHLIFQNEEKLLRFFTAKQNSVGLIKAFKRVCGGKIFLGELAGDCFFTV